ncbi:hypothetical protein [Piscirickettsia litoralis]|uniref:hypothetical protein n=1 Tax=Piscirickettsia litoralis TaxID=1891921 RepID=UPI001F372843|nr:hypothetical protein [Piscirickettsia litoralis]
MKEKAISIEHTAGQSIATPWQLISRLINRHWFLKYPWQLSKFLGKKSRHLWSWLWQSSCDRSSRLQKVDHGVKNTIEKHELTLGFLKHSSLTLEQQGGVAQLTFFSA